MKKLDRALLPTNKKFGLFIAVLALVACASFFAVKRVYSEFLEYDDQQNRSEAVMAASIVNERINSRLLQLRAMAYTPGTDRGMLNTAEKLARLRERAREMGYLRFAVTNTEGLSITTDGKTLNTGTEPQFLRASSSFAATSPIFKDRLTDAAGVRNNIIVLEVPMFKGANIIGTLSAAMKASSASLMLDDIYIRYSGAGLFLIDSNFMVIACSDISQDSLLKKGSGRLLYYYLSDILSTDEQASIARTLRGGLADNVYLYTPKRGGLCLSFAPLPASDGWALVSVSSSSGIRDSQISLLMRFGSAFFLMVLLLVATTAYLYVIHWKYLRVMKFTRIFMDSSSVYFLSITRSGEIRYCEEDFRSFLGLPADGRPFSLAELAGPGQTTFPLSSLTAGSSFRVMIKKMGGGTLYLMLELIEDGSGDTVPALAIDVTGDEVTQEKLLNLAYKDRTTGLPNSYNFALKVEELSARCREKSFTCAVVFIDVTDSHRIVELFSEGAYSHIMAEVANRLRAIAEQLSAPLYCLKREEFALLLVNYADSEEPQRLCAKIRESFAVPFSSADSKFAVNCRTGVIICSEYERGEPISTGEMFRYGEIALARAKGSQNGSFTLDDQTYETVASQLELEYDLSQALKRGELSLFFQPIYSAQKDIIVGAEALLRWHSARHGQVPPDQFIPLAEKNGYINKIGDFVTDSALAAAARFQQLGVALEFNVSLVQFMQIGFAEKLIDKFARNGLKRGSAGIEITESCFLNDAGGVSGKLSLIRDAGLSVLIDDFGSGYSSLSYLKDIPANYLKIDKSFIDGIENSESLMAIVSSAGSVARAVGMEVIAEGVETASQLGAVVQCGCSLIQGFFIARPMPEEAFIEFTKQFNKGKGI